MITLYIAGPLTTGCFATPPFNLWRWEQNVRIAEQMALALIKAGFAVICVHQNARFFFFGEVPEALALEADFELIRRSDALVLLEG